MRLITGVPALQAHSTLRYAEWRAVIAEFVASQLGCDPAHLIPQTVAHAALGTWIAAFLVWVDDPSSDLTAVPFDEASACSAPAWPTHRRLGAPRGRRPGPEPGPEPGPARMGHNTTLGPPREPNGFGHECGSFRRSRRRRTAECCVMSQSTPSPTNGTVGITPLAPTRVRWTARPQRPRSRARRHASHMPAPRADSSASRRPA